jgi:hypothetical protein
LNIIIGRYESREAAEERHGGPLPDTVLVPGERYESWIEDEAKTWIVFVDVHGNPTVWLQRDEEGGVVGEPVTRATQ